MFHSSEGLFFQRATGDGAVRIIKTSDGRQPGQSNVILDQTIPGGHWGSIIATVSKQGEENLRWYQAMDWHNGPEDEGI
jgi:hypothetical protein